MRFTLILLIEKSFSNKYFTTYLREFTLVAAWHHRKLQPRKPGSLLPLPSQTRSNLACEVAKTILPDKRETLANFSLYFGRMM
jgi:hypothetical protein